MKCAEVKEKHNGFQQLRMKW